MILVTVGTQLPFDRLVHTVDHWAAAAGRTDVLAQIGAGRAPSRLRWVRSLAPDVFREQLEKASLVVAHAGVGVTLSALRAARPVILLPRRAELGEHRSEHQVATARRLAAWPGVRVCDDVEALLSALDAPPAPPPAGVLSDAAPAPMLEAVRAFVFATEAA